MFRYKLDTSPKKYLCPSCGNKRFVRMIDIETGGLCEERFGRCDREQSCGYFLSPSQVRPLKSQIPGLAHIKPMSATKTPFDTVPESIFQQSVALLPRTTLFQWLSAQFGSQIAKDACTAYGVGGNPFNPSQTAFWQIDPQGKKRTAELIHYNANGKRDRRKHPSWIHAVLKRERILETFSLRQCAYGVHLLAKNGQKKVCVVEGAKTAIVLSVQFPDYLWVGTPGLHGLNSDLMQLLNTQITLLIPDAGFENAWRKKAERQFRTMNTSDLTQEGNDLADLF